MVNRQMLTGEELIVLTFQKTILANASNFGGNFKQAVRNLTGDHIDLIDLGDGNNHFSIIGAGLLQNVWI